MVITISLLTTSQLVLPRKGKLLLSVDSLRLPLSSCYNTKTMLSPRYTAKPIYEREARELMKQYSAVQ